MCELKLGEAEDMFAADGKKLGQIDRFVLSPATNEVTHLVVKKGWLLPEDKVVPMSMVHSSHDDRVVLNEGVTEFDKLPPFEAKHYVEATDVEGRENMGWAAGARPAYYWYPPLGYLGYPAYGLNPYAWPPVETQRNIPKSTVPLKEGSNVISSDGKDMGHLERLFMEADSGKLTHLLISHGLVPDRKLIPAGWIKTVEESSVHLSVPSGVVHRLRPYQP